MEQRDNTAEGALAATICPECGLELTGERAVCACRSDLFETPSEDSLSGQTLGSYKIAEMIGQGGMGVIYKAHDQLIGRTIAVKMLHRHLVNDSQSLQRFNQEAKAAANIEHRNIIQAYDFGVVGATQQPYLVMEYLEGQSLGELIDSGGSLDAQRAVGIFIQVCDGLAAAHAKGILHRDLKPSNIMLTQGHGQQGDLVKIVDFGIAKMLPASGKDVQLTQTGEVFGSPLYMSPEQFVGRQVDVRSDIYAMGCVMYEALIGTPPFQGEHVLETMYKHMNEAPQRFAQVRPDLKISPKLEAVVLRALEKEPAQRYGGMRELHDDLLRTSAGFKDNRPLPVRVKAWASGLRRHLKRYNEAASNALFAGLVVLIALCLAAFGYMFLQNAQESQWRTLKQEAQKYYALEDYDKAADKLKQAQKLAKQNFGTEDPRYIDTLKRLAWVLNASGDYSGGRELFKHVYNLSDQDLLKVRFAQMVLANIGGSGLFDEARGLVAPELACRRASETIEKFLGSNDPELIPILDEMALMYQKEQPPRFAEAETEYLRIFSIMRETEGDQSAGAARAHKLLGDLYMAWAAYELKGKRSEDAALHKQEAVRNYTDAIEMLSKLSGADCKEVQEVKDALAGKDTPLQKQLSKPAEFKPETDAIPEF